VKQVKPGEKLVDKVIEETRRLKLKQIGCDTITVSTYLVFSQELKDVKIEEKPDLCWNLRRIKEEKEIALMKRAAYLTDVGAKAAVEAVKPGVHEYEVAAEAEYAMRSKGSEGTAFETIVASGTRAAYPHGICSDRIICEGEFVIIDLGATYQGYKCDITRTVIAGTPKKEQNKVFDVVLEAQKAGVMSIHAGVTAKDADTTVREIIDKAGYGENFLHSLGHGVGLDIHELPTLSQLSKDTLTEGNVVTVEPGIYLPNFGGVRIEDTIVVLKDHAELLTKTSKNLIY
jgi:Xaa-Pro dipeptidase